MTQTKADWLRSEIEKLEGSKQVSVLCRQCGEDSLDKATGLGKVAFELQCKKCGNYQEANADVAQWNQALTSIITRYKEELLELDGKKV